MTNEEMSARTKSRLAQVLKEKMMKKKLSKITVSELAAAADINRKTFYYYFEDIYALLKWVLEEEALSVVRHFEISMNYLEAIHFVMDYIEQNEYLISCARDSLGIDGLKRFFRQDALGIITKALSDAEKERDIVLDSEYKNFLTLFLTDAVAGILLDWTQDMRPVNRDKVSRYLMAILDAVLNVNLTDL